MKEHLQRECAAYIIYYKLHGKLRSLDSAALWPQGDFFFFPSEAGQRLKNQLL